MHSLLVNLVPAGDDHYYECFIDGSVQLDLYLDDQGRWVDVEFGGSPLADDMGMIIEMYQLKQNGHQ